MHKRWYQWIFHWNRFRFIIFLLRYDRHFFFEKKSTNKQQKKIFIMCYLNARTFFAVVHLRRKKSISKFKIWIEENLTLNIKLCKLIVKSHEMTQIEKNAEYLFVPSKFALMLLSFFFIYSSDQISMEREKNV